MKIQEKKPNRLVFVGTIVEGWDEALLVCDENGKATIALPELIHRHTSIRLNEKPHVRITIERLDTLEEGG